MAYCRQLTSTYQEFSQTMIRQSFAFVTLPIVGSDEPCNAPGRYGTGSIGKVQFQSHAVAWIERFAREFLFSGARVVQCLDPYSLHDGGPVNGVLALYVPRNRSSAMSIKDFVVEPPSCNPTCGLVFVTARGHPSEVGDGWCISFDLAINDYDLDCVTRLQCLLQGLCPSSTVQLALARKSIRLNPEVAQRFQMVLGCPSATRHPRPLSLSEAILLVAACARAPRGKRPRCNEPLSPPRMPPAMREKEDRKRSRYETSASPLPVTTTDVSLDEAEPGGRASTPTLFGNTSASPVSPAVSTQMSPRAFPLQGKAHEQLPTFSIARKERHWEEAPSTPSTLPHPKTPTGLVLESARRYERPPTPAQLQDPVMQDEKSTDVPSPPPTPAGTFAEGCQETHCPITPVSLSWPWDSSDGTQPVALLLEMTESRSSSPRGSPRPSPVQSPSSQPLFSISTTPTVDKQSLPTIASSELIQSAHRTPEQSPRRPSPLVTPVAPDISSSPRTSVTLGPFIFDENDKTHEENTKEEEGGAEVGAGEVGGGHGGEEGKEEKKKRKKKKKKKKRKKKENKKKRQKEEEKEEKKKKTKKKNKKARRRIQNMNLRSCPRMEVAHLCPSTKLELVRQNLLCPIVPSRPHSVLQAHYLLRPRISGKVDCTSTSIRVS